MLDRTKFVLLDEAHLRGEDPNDRIGSHLMRVNEGNGYIEIKVTITSMDVKRYTAEKNTSFPH